MERLRPELDTNQAVTELEIGVTIGHRDSVKTWARLRWQYDETEAPAPAGVDPSGPEGVPTWQR